MARTPNTTVSDALDLPQVRAYLAQLGVTIDDDELNQIRALGHGQVLPLYTTHSNNTNRRNTNPAAIPTAIVIAAHESDVEADVIVIESDDEAAPSTAPTAAPAVAPVAAPAPAAAPVVAPVAPILAAAPIAAPFASPTAAPATQAALSALAAHIPPRPPAVQESTPAIICPTCHTGYGLTAIKLPDPWYVVFTGRMVGLFATAHEADAQVIYVRGGARKQYDTYDQALEAFCSATLLGKVTVHLGKNNQALLDAKQAEERAAAARGAGAA